jgi:hypothetical protein
MKITDFYVARKWPSCKNEVSTPFQKAIKRRTIEEPAGRTLLKPVQDFSRILPFKKFHSKVKVIAPEKNI